MSYAFEIAAASPPSPAALRDALDLPDLRGFPDDDASPGWPPEGLRLHRSGLSTRVTEVDWQAPEGREEAGTIRVVVRPLASREDGDLAVRAVEAAATLAGAGEVEADYFGNITLGEVRRLHPEAWMTEQAASGTRALATLVRDGKGPVAVPGPRRSCWIGPRLLSEVDSAGPPESLPDRMLATLRRVQWDTPAGFRDAGVFTSGETRFAVWLPGENLIIPRVDHVALRVTAGEIIMVPFAAVADLAGDRGELLDECQLLVPATDPDTWAAIVARARPLASKPRK